MTLDEVLLQKLANWRPNTTTQALNLQHGESGWSIALVAHAVETLGSRLQELRLVRTTPLATTQTLEEQAQTIAGKVTGLLEPLRLVEVDRDHGVAQLRSQAPASRGEKRQYYEILRHADGTTVISRYQAALTGGKREKISFTLTHDALAKLVRDLTN